MYFKVTIYTAIFILFLGTLESCKPKYNETENELRALTINIPLDSLDVLIPKRGLPSIMKTDNSPNFRYVVYFDSTICSSCSLKKMGIWNSIMHHTKEMGANVDYIFIMNPKSDMIQKFRNDYYAQRLNLRFYLDSTGVTIRQNPLLGKSEIYRAFVLNRENHIEVIGDASKNLKVEERFYDFLKKKMAEDQD